MPYLNYALAGVAVILMAGDLFLAVRLRSALRGGEVREKWTLMTILLVFFFSGYIAGPVFLLLDLPTEVMSVLTFTVFIMGAIFVRVAIGIIKDALSFFELLERGK